MTHFKNFPLLATLALLPYFTSYAQSSLKDRFWIGIDLQRSVPDVLSKTPREPFSLKRFGSIDSTFLTPSSTLQENIILGGVLSYGLSEVLQIQTGVYFRFFEVEWENSFAVTDVEIPNESYRVWGGGEKLASYKYSTLQIPLRFRLNQPVAETRFSVFADLGYSLGIHLSESPIATSFPGAKLLNGTFNTSADTSISYRGFYGIQHPSRLYHLIEVGAGVKYKLTERLVALLNISYHQGVGGRTKITSALENEDTQQNTFVRSTNYGFYGMTLGVRYGLFDE